jgi:hypothetical protein
MARGRIELDPVDFSPTSPLFEDIAHALVEVKGP